ncbi:MAG: penicillin-binding protein, partial [Gemmatimonadetes bacterium]|nr:penicillin-binding protein [Gemmatimonadota bacterium]
MNHSLKSAALALVLLPLTAEAGTAQDPPPQKIDAIFTEFDHSGSVGCAVGVARNGEFVYKKGYG